MTLDPSRALGRQAACCCLACIKLELKLDENASTLHCMLQYTLMVLTLRVPAMLSHMRRSVTQEVGLVVGVN